MDLPYDTYLVGGAVRDELLGLAVHERDWVVVGATEAAMTALGFKQVGRDFPVFLHPVTGDEYALARTERKIGRGHTGFVCHAGPEVTLEEDLQRRDLTVNAIAKRASGELVDPLGGVQDLEAGVLRHVSGAFREDPLRVLRVARFAARFPTFRVAPETQAVLREMNAMGMLDELAAERVWQEFKKTVAAAAPWRFFEVLGDVHGGQPWFAEFDLAAAAIFYRRFGSEAPADRLVALGLLLGANGVAAFGRRLKVPKRVIVDAVAVARHQEVVGRFANADAGALYQALVSFGAGHDAARAARLIGVVAASTGRDLAPLLGAVDVLRGVVLADSDKELTGPAYGAALDRERVHAIIAWRGALPSM